jgi:hypothetical protein
LIISNNFISEYFLRVTRVTTPSDNGQTRGASKERDVAHRSRQMTLLKNAFAVRFQTDQQIRVDMIDLRAQLHTTLAPPAFVITNRAKASTSFRPLGVISENPSARGIA